MDIQIGKIYENKTWKYLVPCLRVYGSVFVKKLNIVHKLAVGIYDTSLANSKISQGRNVYILVDKKLNEIAYKDFTNFIRSHHSYVTDYCPAADITRTRKHMFVIKIPEVFNHAYDQFLLSKYSEMYTRDELNTFFSDKAKEKELKVLRRDPQALDEFLETLRKEFNVITNPSDFLDAEWELPIKNKEEVFYYNNGEIYFNRGKQVQESET